VADYYSILFKAVSALEPNTASARQRLYERARSSMSAEIEGASPPFDASDIAAAKQGLKSAIDRIEAEALPAWLRQQERAVCAVAERATADLLPDQGAYRFLDASEIAAAQQGLERAIESIEAKAIPDWPRQAGAALANDCSATADLPAEIEGACPDGSEIAAAMERLESAIESVKAEAIPACPQQSEHAVCANDCPARADLPAEIEAISPPFHASIIVATEQGLQSTSIERIEAQAIPDWLEQLERAMCANDCPATADLPLEIEGAYPPFHSSEIVATERGLESAIERIEAAPIPDWLRQPERDVRSGECPATAANQDEDSPGPLKRLWTRVTGRTTGSHTASPGQDTWSTDLFERASDEAGKDEQDFAPKQAHIR
jgi:hypothetical protein